MKNIPAILEKFMAKDIANMIYWEFSGIPINSHAVKQTKIGVLSQVKYKRVLRELHEWAAQLRNRHHRN
jgi:hypothetical protein